MILVVDTHALVWFLTDDPKLGSQAREALSLREGVEIVIPIIVLFEFSYLQKKRDLPVSMGEIKTWIAGNPHVRVYPTDMSILDSSPKGFEIHDSIIAGTAITLTRSGRNDVFVVTCDHVLKNCPDIKILW
jgi:PIN domain nuclease of toxin-antitoxin system